VQRGALHCGAACLLSLALHNDHPLACTLSPKPYTLHAHRYEVHHGVRISDGALVEAAAASDRYIAGKYRTAC
jgi:AAA lid domain